MQIRLEVVTIPVSDVDRATRFYADVLGFTLDVDYHPADGFRVVQLTPPGSAVSVQFGLGLTEAAPGSGAGYYLVVEDIVSAHAAFSANGADVGAIRHKDPLGQWAGGLADGVDPARTDYASFFDLHDPDGNTWTVQEIGFRP